MKRAVFIFGAGASASAGLPVQANLLKDYFGDSLVIPDSFRNLLVTFFRDFYHIDTQSMRSDIPFPTFEEALGVLELSIEREEAFGPNYTVQKIRDIRDALIYSMGIAIDRKGVIQNNTYHRFVRKLFHRGHFLNNEYGFINFNYDIVLDKALMNLKHEECGITIDYGIDFANENQEGQGGNFQEWYPVSDESVQYLKPHGSFNWMHCPTCNSIYILGNEKSRVFTTGYIHEKESCVKDNTPLDCVIEPPSFFKRYKNAYVQQIWNSMSSLLHQAEVIVFVGYSLPDADMWTKYILKRACFSNNKRLIVVNNSEWEEQKYRRFLGEVEYLKITFDEYVSSWTTYHQTWR